MPARSRGTASISVRGNGRSDTLAQAREDRLDAPQVGGALALGSVAQTLAGALLAGLAQGVDKQPGTADHIVAGEAGQGSDGVAVGMPDEGL
jgi:hypothetical protein